MVQVGQTEPCCIALPAPCDEETVNVKFDIHTRMLSVELQLLSTAAPCPEAAAQRPSKAKDSFKDYYSKWDAMEVSGEEEEEEEETLELAALEERARQLHDAELAANELHEHVLTVQRDGAEAALEADIQRLGLDEGLEDWTEQESGEVVPGQVEEADEGKSGEDVKDAQAKLEHQHQVLKAKDAQLKALLEAPMKIAASPQQSIVPAPKAPKKKPTGYNNSYSKWDHFVDSDEEEEKPAAGGDQRQELKVLAGQLSSFQQSRQAREKERDAYWARHSVLKKT